MTLALVNLVVLAFAVAGLSTTITKAKLTAPIRAWVKKRSDLFGYMLGCPYCISHWIAVILVGFSRENYLFGGPVRDWFIQTFAVVALAAIITGAIMRMLGWHEAEVEELRNENDALRATLREIAEAGHGTEAEESTRAS